MVRPTRPTEFIPVVTDDETAYIPAHALSEPKVGRRVWWFTTVIGAALLALAGVWLSLTNGQEHVARPAERPSATGAVATPTPTPSASPSASTPAPTPTPMVSTKTVRVTGPTAYVTTVKTVTATTTVTETITATPTPPPA